MLFNFNDIPEKKIQKMNGGNGEILAKMYIEKDKIIHCNIAPGSSIGLHKHTTSDDINFILSGNGKAICDGKEEILFPGTCHICKKGSEHSIINTGVEDLVLFTVVIEK